MLGKTYSLHAFPVIAFTIAILSFGWLGASAAPLPFSNVSVLLDGPLPSDQAAEATTQAASAGFDGVLVDSSATQTIAQTVAALDQAGLTANFVRCELPTDSPLITSDSSRDAFVAILRSASAMAHDGAMHGVVLEVDTDQLLFDPWWDGHDPAVPYPDGLVEAAFATGEAIADAVLDEWADAQIIVSMSASSPNGPLVFPFVAGVLATGADRSATVDLVAPVSAVQFDRASLDPPLPDLWASVLAFVPISQRVTTTNQVGRGVRLTDPQAEVLTWAKLVCTRVILVDFPGGLTLRSVRSPVDSFGRVGPYPSAGSPAYVLTGPRGAAAYFPAGIYDGLTINEARDAVTVIEVATGTRSEFRASPGGAILIPATTEPVVADGLPVAQWATPAGFWIDPATRYSDQEWPVSFGWKNGSQFNFAGRLDAALAARSAISPPGAVVRTRPGEAVAVQAVVRGALKTGEAPAIRLVLSPSTATPIEHRSILPVPPVTQWELTTDSVVAGGVCRIDDADEPLNVIATTAGALHALRDDGSLAWERIDAHGFAMSPIAFKHWTGAPCCATVNRANALTAWESDGRSRWTVRMPEGEVAAIAHADLHRHPGDELAIAYKDGRLVALLSSGLPLWPLNIDASVQELVVVSGGGGELDALLAVHANGLTFIDWHGAVRWTSETDRVITSSAVVAANQIITGMENGQVIQWNAIDGSIAQDTIRMPGPVIGIAASGTNAIAVASPAIIAAFDINGARQWYVEGRWSSLWESEGRIYAGERHGGLLALAENGTTIWRNPHVGGIPMGEPMPLSGDGQLLYASSDFRLRCLDTNR